jgi:hypothetical protein
MYSCWIFQQEKGEFSQLSHLEVIKLIGGFSWLEVVTKAGNTIGILLHPALRLKKLSDGSLKCKDATYFPILLLGCCNSLCGISIIAFMPFFFRFCEIIFKGTVSRDF